MANQANIGILKGLQVELTDEANYVTGKNRRGKITGIHAMPLCHGKKVFFHIVGPGIKNGKGAFYTIHFFKFVENENIQKRSYGNGNQNETKKAVDAPAHV